MLLLTGGCEGAWDPDQDDFLASEIWCAQLIELLSGFA
jgi:hypothetical protein